MDLLLSLALELQRHNNNQQKVLPSSLVNAVDVIVVLDARHEMLLGRKLGGSSSWRFSIGEQPPQHSPPPSAVETLTGIIAQSPVKTPDKENKPEHPVKKSFKCEQCDFSSDTKRGLSVHKWKATSNVNI